MKLFLLYGIVMQNCIILVPFMQLIILLLILFCRGAGKVFFAQDRSDSTCTVAIKYIDLLEQFSVMGLIAQEISILRSVRHTNIINFISKS